MKKVQFFCSSYCCNDGNIRCCFRKVRWRQKSDVNTTKDGNASKCGGDKKAPDGKCGTGKQG